MVNQDLKNDLEYAIDEHLRLLHEREFEVWWNASKMLVSIGAPAMGRLLDLLEKSQNDISIVAGITLGEMKNRDAMPRLLELCRYPNVWVRRGVIIALGRIGDRAAMPILFEALSDSYSDVQNDAAQALSNMGDPAAMPALAEALRLSEGAFGFAGSALGDFGEQALPYLLDAIRGGYHHELMWATMEHIGQPAVAPLLALLEDPTVTLGTVASNAAGFLGRLGDPSAIPALRRALFRGDDSLCGSAARALSCLDDPTVIEPLLEGLTRDDARIRGMVAGSIIPLQDNRVVEALIALLADERRVWEADPHMRLKRVSEMAAERLAMIGTEPALHALAAWRQGDAV